MMLVLIVYMNHVFMRSNSRCGLDRRQSAILIEMTKKKKVDHCIWSCLLKQGRREKERKKRNNKKKREILSSVDVTSTLI